MARVLETRHALPLRYKIFFIGSSKADEWTRDEILLPVDNTGMLFIF